MKHTLILLIICIVVLSTGCTLFKIKERTVNYHKLEGLTVTGEGWRSEYKYPKEIAGIELESFDFNTLTPRAKQYCQDLKVKAGGDLSCLAQPCNSLAMEYGRAYKICHGAIVTYQEEEKIKAFRSYIKTQKVAQTNRYEESAITFMGAYAEANNLNLSEMKYYSQPLSIEYVMGKIKKGEFDAPMYFNVKCCGGYKVSQPITGGYMLTTENYGGLPIMLKTNTTLFEGNKAGRSLGWLKYDGVTKYKTVTGTNRQAILMTEIK